MGAEPLSSEVVVRLGSPLTNGAIMNDNIITVTGNVCADLVTRSTPSGAQVTSLRLASTPRRLRNGTWEDGETTFFTVNCWRTLGQHVFASVHRGDPIVVQGVLRVRNWESNDKSGTSVEIEAHTVGFDLNRGSAVFTRAQKAAPPMQAEALDAGLRGDSASEVLAGTAA